MVVRPRGYSIFILTILRILTTDTYFTRHLFPVIAVTCLARDILLAGVLRRCLLVHLHLFLVLKAEFMDIAVLTSNG